MDASDPWDEDDQPQDPPTRGRHRRRQERAVQPVAEVVDRRPVPARRSWRDLPRPSRSALLGATALAAVAAGAIHLSASGTAVPLEQTGASASAAPAAPGTAAPSEGASSGAGSSGAGSGSAGSHSAGSGRAGSAGAGAGGAGASSGAGQGDGTGEIVVHVTGAVRSPGVVHLPAGSRVDDAVREAGGASAKADLSAVNLARPAADGEQIHVPRPGEEPLPASSQTGGSSQGNSGTDSAGSSGGGAASGSGGSSGSAGSSGGGAASAGGTININTADLAQLDELPGVGPAIAQRIIDHREKNGPFTSVDSLEDVAGIGPATLAKIRDRASVS